ncbi:hypothetical protein Tco_1311582 [Tanacetum coccineum]
MALEHISPGLGHQLMTPGIISLALEPQPPSLIPNVPPTKNDWDSVFCPMFDEYFNPSPSVVQPVLVAVVQEPVVSTGTHSSTRIDQDTPSTSTSQTTQEEQSHVTPTSVEEDDHGIEVAHMDNDLLNAKQSPKTLKKQADGTKEVNWYTSYHLANENVPAPAPTSSDEEILPSGGRLRDIDYRLIQRTE